MTVAPISTRDLAGSYSATLVARFEEHPQYTDSHKTYTFTVTIPDFVYRDTDQPYFYPDLSPIIVLIKEPTEWEYTIPEIFSPNQKEVELTIDLGST